MPPTGRSTHNAQGLTSNSALFLPAPLYDAPKNPTEPANSPLKETKVGELRTICVDLHILILEEVSMSRGRILGAIGERMSHIFTKQFRGV